MGYERRDDSQQMDFRNDWKMRCDHCYGTGRVIGLHEAMGGAVVASGDYYIECPACRGIGRKR